MLRHVEDTFHVTRGTNLFELPYDWRRDNRVAASRLQRQAHTWVKAGQSSSGAADAELVLSGHWMGGLVARYFRKCLHGSRDTARAVGRHAVEALEPVTDLLTVLAP